MVGKLAVTGGKTQQFFIPAKEVDFLFLGGNNPTPSK